MTKPNAMGRIEATPKPKRAKKDIKWGRIGVTTLMVALYLGGMATVVQYNEFIERVEAQGVSEYKDLNCKKFTDKNVAWLECNE